MLTKINGAQYNTRDKQQAAYSNIQVKDKGLWGEPIVKKPAPVVTPITPVDNNIVDVVRGSKPPVTLQETNLAKNQPYYNKDIAGTGIQLNGEISPEQKAIADKYSSFYKSPIAINVVPGDAAKGGKFSGQSVNGLNSYFPDGSRKITISADMDNDSFELVMLHEIAHNVFHYDEDSAWDYAIGMNKIINQQQ